MSSGGGVRSWPWEHVREVLRLYGPEIGRLARLGDRLARQVRERYQYAYDHPHDPQANAALRDALNEYLQRDLLESEQHELGARFGHRLAEPEREGGPRVIVPETVTRQ